MFTDEIGPNTSEAMEDATDVWERPPDGIVVETNLEGKDFAHAWEFLKGFEQKTRLRMSVHFSHAVCDYLRKLCAAGSREPSMANPFDGRGCSRDRAKRLVEMDGYLSRETTADDILSELARYGAGVPLSLAQVIRNDIMLLRTYLWIVRGLRTGL